MALIVIIGGVRSGKSRAAEALASERGTHVYVATAGSAERDPEMARRIAEHRRRRPAGWQTLEVHGRHPSTWLDDVPSDAVLVLDCLGTLIASLIFEEVDDATLVAEREERRALAMVDSVVDALLARRGDSIIVTNEVGCGVVPAFASGRLFRDLLGSANASLVRRADAAYLMMAGVCIDLKTVGTLPAWPARRETGRTGSRMEDV